MSNYVRLRKGESRRKRDSKLRGQGIAVYVEPCGAGWESAFVGLDHLGRIVAGTGSTSQGQGRETAAAQIVSAALGVAPEQVVIHHGDTASAPYGIGALASRSTAIGGSALLEAAKKFEERARTQPRTCCRQASNASNGIHPASRFGETESSWFAGAI